MTSKPPFPPFTLETAIQKARMAENAWNGRDPQAVAMAYTEDSRWRNRSEFIQGRDQILQFLKRKWAKEVDYRLIKEVWAYTDNRIAVRFQYEWHDESGDFFSLPRQRKLGVLGNWTDATPRSQYQRCAHSRKRQAVHLGRWAAT